MGKKKNKEKSSGDDGEKKSRPQQQAGQQQQAGPAPQQQQQPKQQQAQPAPQPQQPPRQQQQQPGDQQTQRRAQQQYDDEAAGHQQQMKGFRRGTRGRGQQAVGRGAPQFTQQQQQASGPPQFTQQQQAPGVPRHTQQQQQAPGPPQFTQQQQAPGAPRFSQQQPPGFFSGFAPQQQFPPPQLQGAWMRQPSPYPQPQPMQQPVFQQQQQQQQPRGWTPRQVTPVSTPLLSPTSSSRESSLASRDMSMSPEVQSREEQPDQKGKKKPRQKKRQGQQDVPQPADTAQPIPQQTQPPPTVPQEQPAQGAVPKQRGDRQQPPPKQQAQQFGAGDTAGGVAETKKSLDKISITGGGGDVPLIRSQERKVMRKGGSACRKKIMVVTNHFPLSLGKLTRALHYDVAIVPDKPKKLFRPVMEAFRQTFYKDRYPAFDGMKNLYSAHPLCTSEMSGTVKVMEDNREREFQVTIKQVAYVDLSCLNDYFTKIGKEGLDKPMQALQCIDIILRSAPSLNCIPAGRSYFNVPVGATIKLGDGTELFNGFYQSAVLGWKPFLNLDVAHKAFPMQMMVVDYINEITGNRADWKSPLRRPDEEMLQKHMRQLKVQYELPKVPGSKRIWRVNGLGDPPNKAKFKDDKGRVTTVESYFANEKRIRLNYPNWPTLWVGSTQRENKILLPLEFCMILRGQAVNKKMTENQTRNMIKEAATSAPVRLQKIQESMAKAKYNQSPAVTEFGINVSEQPQKVQARVLEPPTLEYAQKRTETVSRGVWRGTRFHTGVRIQAWTIICLDDRTRKEKLEELEQFLIRSGQKFGVEIPQARRDNGRDFLYLREDYRNPKRLKQDLIEYLKTTQYSLVVVVVPDNSKSAYHYVKQAAELTVGRLTQCIRGRTLLRLNPTMTDNILLKINAKLNGVNHILSGNFQPSCFRKPVVIMGADVTHPSPDAQNIPSVAAVTCSYDRNGFKYIFSWRLQEPKLEIIKDLEAIVVEQLRYFREQNKCEPLRIIFFRDGVSDGQFAEVRSNELRAIRNACSKLNPNYKPQISFFVVQKRHHTRLFPVDDRDSEDKNKNVPAGTCVDTIITHPSVYDFYLVSHASIQGVAKPTKYVPLWDDADMSEDDIQHLTYYLCHLFARCNRSVSYPTPTYYAHLAAARAKVYIETEVIDMRRLEETQRRLQVEESIIRNLPMYFV